MVRRGEGRREEGEREEKLTYDLLTTIMLMVDHKPSDTDHYSLTTSRKDGGKRGRGKEKKKKT